MREVTPFSNPLTYDPFPGSLCITQRHRNALCESVSHIFIIAGSITLHHFMRTIKARGSTLVALAISGALRNGQRLLCGNFVRYILYHNSDENPYS